MGHEAHRHAAQDKVHVAILVISDTRSAQTDRSGKEIAALLEAAGHAVVALDIVPDESSEIRAWLDEKVQALEDDPSTAEALILTGGTGIAGRDVTIATIEPLLGPVLPGFGELFRMLSFGEIGAAAMLSRATAGVFQGRPLFALPGSRKAVRLAMEKLILPELGHIVYELKKQRHVVYELKKQRKQGIEI
jgi:molybdopterin adenylyltransferase